MAGEDITVIVGGSDDNQSNESQPSANAKSEAGPTNDTDKSVQGVNDNSENLTEVLEKLEKSLPDSMKEIVNAVSGLLPEGSLDLRTISTEIIDNISSLANPEPEGKKDKSFIKATKLDKLKPQDINIIDRQFTLGPLLVYSELVSIENLLKSRLKTGDKDKGKNDKKEGNKLPSLKSKASDIIGVISEALITLPPLLVQSSKELGKVKWKNFTKAVEVLPVFMKSMVKLAKDVSKDKDKLKELQQIAEGLYKTFKHLFLASLLATIGIPFFITGTVGVLASTLFVLTTKLLFKVMPKVKDVAMGTLVALLMVPFFGAMLINVFLASMAAKVSIKQLLLGMANIGIVTGLSLLVFALIGIPFVAGLVALGGVTAILMAVGLAALGVVTEKIVYPLGKLDSKQVLVGIQNIVAVTWRSTLIFALLGLLTPLVIIGNIGAVGLTLGFTIINLAFIMAIKAGKRANEALAALGVLGTRTVNGNDPANDKDSTGILGFISRFGSKTLTSLLLHSIIPAGLLALVGALLFIGGGLMEKGIKAFDDIGNKYFPPDKKVLTTGPVRGLMGIVSFADIIANGYTDEDGRSVEPIGLKTIIGLIPMIALGFVLKLTAGKLSEGLDAFASGIKSESITKASGVIKSIGQFFVDMQTNFIGRLNEDRDTGLIGNLINAVFGEDSILNTLGGLLSKVFPLLALAGVGYILQLIVNPLGEGIEGFATIAKNEDTLKKLAQKDGIFDNLMNVITNLSTRLDTDEKKIEKFKKFKEAFEAFQIIVNSIITLIPSIITLGEVKDGTQITAGITRLNSFMRQIVSNSDRGSMLGIMTAFNNADLSKINKSVFTQIKELFDTVTPLVNAVVEMGKEDENSVKAGLQAVKDIIEMINETTKETMSDGSESTGELLTKGASNFLNMLMADKNPIFMIIEKFSDPKLDMSKVVTNMQGFSTSMKSLSTALTQFDTIDSTKFINFANAISGFGLGGAITSMTKFAELNPEFSTMANYLQSIATSLKSIAADSDKLNDINLNVNNAANASNLTEKAADIRNNDLISVEQSIQEYVKNISDVVISWSQNGIKVMNTKERDIYEQPANTNAEVPEMEDIL